MTMSKMYWIIDDGHGSGTPGKRSPIFTDTATINNNFYPKGYSFTENEFNSYISKGLVSRLNHMGIGSQELVPSDVDVPLHTRISLEKRIRKTIWNKYKKETILISIHANAHEPYNKILGRSELIFNDANGIETFYYKPSEKGKLLAAVFQSNLVGATGLRDRGIKCTPSMYMVKESDSPAILIECGFMTNRKELHLLMSPAYREVVINSLINSVKYFEEYGL